MLAAQAPCEGPGLSGQCRLSVGSGVGSSLVEMRELIDRYDPDLEQAVGLHHLANERLGSERLGAFSTAKNPTSAPVL